MNEVDDIEMVRRYFDLDQLDLLAHSYAAKTAVLYALNHPSRVRRLVQIGGVRPDESRQYPAHLSGADSTLQEFFYQAAQLEKERRSLEPQEFCRRFWSLLRSIYVADPANAGKIHWERCDLPTELNLMTYWVHYLLPSIERAALGAEDLRDLNIPVLIVHGTKDRSSPYGGAREWAMALPDARLLSIEEAAHAPVDRGARASAGADTDISRWDLAEAAVRLRSMEISRRWCE